MKGSPQAGAGADVASLRQTRTLAGAGAGAGGGGFGGEGYVCRQRCIDKGSELRLSLLDITRGLELAT